jgi:hypothetical protein
MLSPKSGGTLPQVESSIKSGIPAGISGIAAPKPLAQTGRRRHILRDKKGQR